MQYLKNELNKILPLALLFGAIGGILLIVVTNLLEPSMVSILVSYGLIIGSSVYILNRMRYKNEMKGSVLYGYCVYLVMTAIAYVDTVMNANADFVNPIFENLAFFIALLAAVLFFSGSIALLFKRKVLH
ncbi:MAG: hypothetical protein ACI857_000300 [Arenicella sp.]|jgi:hypothetical protein